MRRLIILFMLCLLPVQISWAVVSDYAAHEPSDNPHDVHHLDSHAVATVFDLDLPSQSGEPDQANLQHDHCHCAGYIGLLTMAQFNSAMVPDVLYMQGTSPVYTSQILDRPERPKWLPLA